MILHHWVSVLALSVLALAAGGCSSDGVVYVDEQGNELAVDADGKPVYQHPDSARAPSVVTTMPVEPANAPAEYVGPVVPQPAPDAPPAGAVPGMPRMDDLPALPPTTPPRPAAPQEKPKKKVDSSSGLGKPPAG